MNQNIIKKTDYPHTIKPLKIHFSKQFKKLTSQCEYEPNNVLNLNLFLAYNLTHFHSFNSNTVIESKEISQQGKLQTVLNISVLLFIPIHLIYM